MRIQYKISLTGAGFSFIISIFLLILRKVKGYGMLDTFKLYNMVESGFYSTVYFGLIPGFFINCRIGIDGISIFFILLTNLFIFLCIFNLSPITLRLKEARIYLFFLQ